MVFTIRARVNGFSTLKVGGKAPAMARRTGLVSMQPSLLDSGNIHCYDYLHDDWTWLHYYL